MDALLHVLEDLNVDVSSGIDDTNMVDFVNKVQYSIKDGYLQFGFNVTQDGTVSVSYLFHKNKDVAGGFATFAELAITIQFERKMEPSQVEQYFEQKKEAVAQWGEETANMLFDYLSGLIIIDPDKKWYEVAGDFILFSLIIAIMFFILTHLVEFLPKPLA